MRTSYSKKHKAGISVLSGLTAALLLLTGCSKSEETVYQIPEDRKLIVYTAHKADVYEPIIKEFEERTGIFVELKAGDTLALFDELQQDAPGIARRKMPIRPFLCCRLYLSITINWSIP